jgi:hypothetical protein
LRLKVRATRVEGTLLAWVPPPPGDRLWSAFVKLPHLDLSVNPVVRQDILPFREACHPSSQPLPCPLTLPHSRRHSKKLARTILRWFGCLPSSVHSEKLISVKVCIIIGSMPREQ